MLNLFILRLTNYRIGIIERLKRLGFLFFFVVAIILPTLAILAQLFLSASTELLTSNRGWESFIHFLIFQFIAALWVGSQHDYLSLAVVENYLRTLNISTIKKFVVDYLFSFVILFPFVAFLAFGMGELFISQHVGVCFINFIYLLCSIFFIAICFIHSRIIVNLILLLTNFVFIYFYAWPIGILLASFLFLLSYLIIDRKFFNLFNYNFPSWKLGHKLFRYSPNIHLNLKGLFVYNKAFTSYIVIFNLLVFLVFILYSIALNNIINTNHAFFVMVFILSYVCSFSSYKIEETRKRYGDYFSIFYNKTTYYRFDFCSIYCLTGCHILIAWLIGYCFGVGFLIFISSSIFASLLLLMFFCINKIGKIYGPIISLVCGISVLVLLRLA